MMKEPNGFWIILCRHGKARTWTASLHCSRRMQLLPCLPPLPGMRVQPQLAYSPPPQSLRMTECSRAEQPDAGVSNGPVPMRRQPLHSINAHKQINIRPLACMCWKFGQADWHKLSVLLIPSYQSASVSLRSWTNQFDLVSSH